MEETITQNQEKGSLIVAIGGGKGGVGKSMVSSNLAVHYAKGGLNVTLIDLDVGAANLHTIFGIRQPPKGLGDYFNTPRSQLQDYLIPTSIPNLTLAPGSGFVPELANLKYAQKVKLINQIKSLSSDLVMLDLGAGTSSNVIDFFSMTHAGIVITTPEPTAIVNAYEFLKNVVYRILFRMFRNQEAILEILKSSVLPQNPLKIATIADLIAVVEKKNPWAAQNIRDVCKDLDFYVVFNQARKLSDIQLGQKLHQICHRFLGINLNFSGIIFFNEEVSASVYKMSPISLVYADSVTSLALKRIATRIFGQLAHKVLNNSSQVSFEEQYAAVMHEAKQDYEQNLLTQKRLQRSKERTLTPGMQLASVGIPDD